MSATKKKPARVEQTQSFLDDVVEVLRKEGYGHMGSKLEAMADTIGHAKSMDKDRNHLIDRIDEMVDGLEVPSVGEEPTVDEKLDFIGDLITQAVPCPTAEVVPPPSIDVIAWDSVRREWVVTLSANVMDENAGFTHWAYTPSEPDVQS